MWVYKKIKIYIMACNSLDSVKYFVPTSACTKTYTLCDGNDLIQVDVTMFLENEYQYLDQNISNVNQVRRRYEFRFDSSAPVTEDLTINYIRDFNLSINGVPTQNYTGFTSSIIPNGSSTTGTIQLDSSVVQTILAGEYAGDTQTWVDDYILSDQLYPPTFCFNPVTCTLEITGTTITNPTLQGGSDGSIEVFVSGSTGTTFYSVNGGAEQGSNLISGLVAGTYFVTARDGSCYSEVEVIVEDGEFRTEPFTVLEPNDVISSENPIITTIATAINNPDPLPAITQFIFDSGVTNNYSVQFNLTNPTAYITTFYAREFPNKDNFFLTPILSDRQGNQVGINTVSEIADSFAEALQKDVNLRRWYFIDVDDNIVTLTAKENSSTNTLNTSNVTILDQNGSIASSGITLSVAQEGVDAFQGSLVNEYSIYADVYVGDGKLEYGEELSAGTYNNFTTIELPFNKRTNIHQFDVSQVMKNFVHTPKIDLTFTGFTVLPTMMRPFYLRYGEKYPLVANENTKKKRQKGETDFKWVINSALEWEQPNNMDDYITGGTFLTNAPNPLQIQRNQTNFLYFVLPKDYGQTLNLVGDIEFYDGTSSSGITFFNISTGTTNIGGVYALNVSYDTLGLLNYESSGNTKIKRVTFSVNDDSGAYTESRIYRFEIDEQPRKFGVSFENKLGGTDTFDFIGVVENSIDRTIKSYTVPREITSNGSSPQGFKSNATYDTKITKNIVVNSGWIDQDHFDWLIELLSSNNIYSYSEPNQNYLNLVDFSYIKSSLDDLFEIEITFTHTIFENNITV